MTPFFGVGSTSTLTRVDGADLGIDGLAMVEMIGRGGLGAVCRCRPCHRLRTTAPLLPLMSEFVAETPAGQRDDGAVVAVTNHPPNLQAVSLVEAIAKVLHPDIDLG